MKTPCEIQKHLLRISGPFSDGARVRKQLTLNIGQINTIPVTLTIYGSNSYIINVQDNYVCATHNNAVITKIPFVAWDDIDEQYESLINESISEDGTIKEIPNDFLELYCKRFPDVFWGDH